MKTFVNLLLTFTLILGTKILHSPEQDLVPTQNQDLFLVREENKVGYVNKQGRVVIPFIFDDGDVFFEGFARVKINQKWGFIDTRGKFVIPEQFDYVGNFSSGLAAVFVDKDRNKNPFYGYINSIGTIVIPIKYEFDMAALDLDFISFSDGIARIRVEGKDSYLNLQGELVFPADIPEKKYFSQGLSLTNFGKPGSSKFGYVNQDGKTVIPPQFSSAAPFSEGFAAVGFGAPVLIGHDISSPRPISEFERVYSGSYALFGHAAFINQKGEVVISFSTPFNMNSQGSAKEKKQTTEPGPFTNWPGSVYEFRSFSQGRAAVKFGNLWGYIDRTGQIVIPPQFEQAYDFQKGIAIVKLNAKHTLINRNGKIIWQAKK